MEPFPDVMLRVRFGRQQIFKNVVCTEFKLNTIRYDTIEEFNVDSKAEYSAHVARKKTKTNKI